MRDLKREVLAHVERKAALRRQAARLVAFRLATGCDLEEALDGPAEELRRMIVRLERLVERERLRGWARHWSYDLNRHIALCEALGELKSSAGNP
ncbi:cytoplasmic protein [Chelativorans sp. ZYF759]|uniref:cytoplasmic protein n=1 Tax=Chelativorans sp. ZYF759 TaxID=2692213 RepID=UPI00145E1E95|nr:cytoplasmic protein [Chelativorans sp. ZYF759]NMG38965.1 cytoplasmic protein [Chelativorans sp. ZYF759]